MTDRDCACGCLSVRLARVCGLSLHVIGCTSALACDVQRYCICSCRLWRYALTFLLPASIDIAKAKLWCTFLLQICLCILSLLCPTYLHDVVHPASEVTTLWHFTNMLIISIIITSHCLRSFTNSTHAFSFPEPAPNWLKRALSITNPSAWNSIPPHIWQHADKYRVVKHFAYFNQVYPLLGAPFTCGAKMSKSQSIPSSRRNLPNIFMTGNFFARCDPVFYNTPLID